MKASTLMPYAGTKIAEQVNHLYEFLLIVSAIGFVVLIGGMIYFIFKYKRQSSTAKSAYITHDARLEFLWSFIPFVFFIASFAWGWHIYHQMRQFPKDAFEVNVTAFQWGWAYQYKSGKKSTELYVPVGKPVKLLINSKDVLHSYFIPAFRVKQDAVPGRYSALWFQAENPGTYNVFCTEYCGAAHSAMLSKVHVLPEEEFEAWLSGGPVLAGGAKEMSLADLGKKLYTERTCVQCHSNQGKANIGPAFNGVFGSQVTMADGTTLKADENYLRESILQSQAKIKKGYAAGQMPVFAGLLDDNEVTALIEYIKTLK